MYTRFSVIIFCVCTLILQSVLGVSPYVNRQDSELLQVIIITRHGDRTPTKLFPNTQSTWPEGLGQLTHIGMKEHFDLGQRFRKIYIEEAKFVNETYQVNEIFVRATPRERTLMSAQSFMMGFYHQQGPAGMPGLVQPVPIYSVDRSADNLLYAYKSCPKLKTLTKEVQMSEEWTNMTSHHSSLISTIDQIFGGPIALKDITGVLNLIHGEQIHKRPSLAGVTEDMIEKMKEIANWIFKRKFKTREMGKLGSGLLVNDLRYRMESTKSIHFTEKRKVDQRFILYSAHDGTLLALMSALDLMHLEVPHYASHLVFELRFRADIGYFVNIIYNGDHVNIPECGVDCHTDKWFKLIEPGMNTNWHNECGGVATSLISSTTSQETFNPSHFYPLSLGFILGAAVMGLISSKVMRSKKGKIRLEDFLPERRKPNFD